MEILENVGNMQYHQKKFNSKLMHSQKYLKAEKK